MSTDPCVRPVMEGLEQRLMMAADGVLIVTSDALSSAFQEVANWYTRKGHPAAVVTTTAISAQYGGDDLQERIRNCIRDYYDNHDVGYVVLGGDNTVVPDRNAYVRVGGYVDSGMPTDLYYSSLSGTWDGDGDGTYGEAGQDLDVSLNYDVIVARYPIRTAQHVATLLAKVVAYETAPPTQDWATEMLATGETLWNVYGAGTYNGISFDHTASDAEIKTMTADTQYVQSNWTERTELDVLFDTYSTWDTAGAGSYDLTRDNLVEAMGNDYQFMHMATHGNDTIWAMESGSYFSSSTIQGLSASTAFNVAVVSTLACNTGAFDRADAALSEAFLRSENTGTVAYLGCSRYGWGYASTSLGPSIRYSYQFYKEVFQNGHSTLGEAFAASKQYFAGSSSYDGAYRWVQFGLNLQGDPLVQIYRDDPVAMSPVYDSSIEASENPQSYTVSGLSAGAKVVLWQGDDLYRVGQADQNGTYQTTITAQTGTVKLTIVSPNSPVFTGDITVTQGGDPPNSAPSAGDDTAMTDQDTPVTVSAPGVLGNDTDPDGDALTVSLADTVSAAGGLVAVNANGSFTYDPNGKFDSLAIGETATDTFGYTVSDGLGGTDTGTVTVTIYGPPDPANRAPIALGDTAVTNEDTPLTVAASGVLGNDTDPDGDALTVGLADTVSAAGGLVAVNPDGGFTYDPNGRFEWLGVGETASDTFEYIVSDGRGGFDTGTVTVTVIGVNDGPVAGDDTAVTDEDTLLTVPAPGVLGNDTDVDGDGLIVSAADATSAAGALISVNADGSFTYDPNGKFESLGVGETATDTFEYTISDGRGGTDTATVTVTITGEADQPPGPWVLDDGVLTVSGTAGDDVFAAVAGAQHQITINGRSETFDSAEVHTIRFLGGDGWDIVSLTGTDGADAATFTPRTASLQGEGYLFQAVESETIRAYGGANDTATMKGTWGNDEFYGYSTHSYMTGPGYYSHAEGFGSVVADSGTWGYDWAYFYDSAGDDTFTAGGREASMTGAGFDNTAVGFDYVFAYASDGGTDRAEISACTGADRFFATPTYGYMTGPWFLHYAEGFEQVVGYGLGVNRAYLYDSAGDDTFTASVGSSSMTGSGFANSAMGFYSVTAYADNGGNDVAYLNGRAWTDVLWAKSDYSRMVGYGYQYYAYGFDSVRADGAGGTDVGFFYDSAGDDTFYCDHAETSMSGAGFDNQADGFTYVYAYSRSGGNDVASLYDSAGNDYFISLSSATYLYGGGYMTYAAGFNEVHGYSTSGGNDIAYLYDSWGNDNLYANGSEAYVSSSSFENHAHGFDRVYAFATWGTDRAYFTDSAGDDTFLANGAYSTMTGPGYYIFASNFDRASASSVNGGNDVAHLYAGTYVDAFYASPTQSYMTGPRCVNTATGFSQVHGYSAGWSRAYLYDSAGDDTFTTRSTSVTMSGAGYQNVAHRFYRAEGYSQNGGTDVAMMYDSAGHDTFFALPTYSYMLGWGFQNFAVGFGTVRAYATAGGYDRAYFYDSGNGDDEYHTTSTESYMTGADYYNHASGFESCQAFSSAAAAPAGYGEICPAPGETFLGASVEPSSAADASESAGPAAVSASDDSSAIAATSVSSGSSAAEFIAATGRGTAGEMTSTRLAVLGGPVADMDIANQDNILDGPGVLTYAQSLRIFDGEAA